MMEDSSSAHSVVYSTGSIMELPEEDHINIQIFIPELQIRKCLTVSLEDLVWDIKKKLYAALTQPLPQSFNYGLFLPPCDGRAGKFLLEDRSIRDYPFHDCVPYLELKYKKRVYKMLNLDEKQLRSIHTKNNLKKFMDYVTSRNADKVEKWCSQGLDANFHDSNGETPLTVASGITGNRTVIMALVGGGAHIDFRNTEGQTAMHKAAFLSSVDNVKTLLELGASPNYRDVIGLTPLYYNMLTADSNDQVAEMLLRETAELGITDMHGNHEIHQACKNGLVKHVEHLLYYGAQPDAENVNGNSPLHVCAVNSRSECARVLLFRGSSHTSVNRQGQTALHVAHIVGAHEVAQVISSHSPSVSVPYRGTPQYSPRRRVSTSSTLTRRRSFSQSSLCSAQTVDYGVPRSIDSGGSIASVRRSTETEQESNYGTMRRYAPEHIATPSNAGHEMNVPRILVIPRGPKGFGFILRGAKHAEAAIAFEPSLLVPGLQFFEGVDMSGMAMRGGLRPGDFLLQIDGIDVTRASHEEVVTLIQAAGDTITLKVITIDPKGAFPQGGSIYGAPSRQQRHQSVGRAGLPPQPPLRMPSTSLSMRNMPPPHRLHHSATLNEMEEYYAAGRCASVMHRPTASRRISAAELESLMIRQSSAVASTSTFQPLQYDQESLNGSQTPKKFTSVADMKRKKQAREGGRGGPDHTPPGLPRRTLQYTQGGYGDPQQNGSLHQNGSIYSSGHASSLYSSSPDIPVQYAESSDGSEMREYSRPFRPSSRPKTPPPPPPPVPTQQQTVSAPSTSKSIPPISSNPPPPPPLPPISSVAGPPPPPPVAAKPLPAPSGITASSLRSVVLKPRSSSIPSTSSPSSSSVPPSLPSLPSLPSSSAPDFHADLKNALAKRRSKVAMNEDEEKKGDTINKCTRKEKEERGTVSAVIVPPKPTFSLDDDPSTAPNGTCGYGSERGSADPSTHTVDTMSLNSSLSTLSGCSLEVVPRGTPPLPPVDYDDPDSGTGDSDGDSHTFVGDSSGPFDSKSVSEWSVGDVVQWLHSIQLHDDYGTTFHKANVTGEWLSRFDRSAFTSLGVTRIAHRQKMEQSIKNFLNNNNQ